METPAKNRDHFLRTCLIAALIVISGFKSDPGVAPARTAGANNSGPSYSLLKSEQDIRLYSRWLPVTDTRKAKQLKAELICKTRLETVLTLISRDENFTRWMK